MTVDKTQAPAEEQVRKEGTPKRKVPKIFDRNPELKARLEAFLADYKPKDKQETIRRFEDFLAGKISWAEMKGYPKVLLKELAKIGYQFYRVGRYDKAEAVFKGLAVMSPDNWYFRSVLGAIYQKQKNYEGAISEYSKAITLKEDEIVSLVNRGECYLRLENFPAALKDFAGAVAHDATGNNKWANRARLLQERLIAEGHRPLT